MSWHSSAIVMEGDHTARALEVFSLFGFPHLRQVGEVTGDEASSGHLAGKAVGLVGGWTLFWDPMLFLHEDPPERGLWPTGVTVSRSAVSNIARACTAFGYRASSS